VESLYIARMELIPDIDSDIPVPLKSSKHLEMSPAAELRARAETIKILSDLTGTPLVPTEDDQSAAESLARQMMSDPEVRPDFSRYQNSTMAFLAGMVAQMNVQIVDELSELKLYVVNKLIFEAENAPDSKTRITALSKLGEIDGVDAFKKRSEVTVQVKPIEEVERELLTVLNNIEYTVVNTPASTEDVEDIDYEIEESDGVENDSDES